MLVAVALTWAAARYLSAWTELRGVPPDCPNPLHTAQSIITEDQRSGYRTRDE